MKWCHCIYFNAIFISQWTEATEYWVPCTTMRPIRCLTMKSEEHANKKAPFICCKWWKFDTEAKNLRREEKRLHKNAINSQNKKWPSLFQSMFSCLDEAGYQKSRIETLDTESKREKNLIRISIANDSSSTEPKH